MVRGAASSPKAGGEPKQAKTVKDEAGLKEGQAAKDEAVPKEESTEGKGAKDVQGKDRGVKAEKDQGHKVKKEEDREVGAEKKVPKDEPPAAGGYPPVNASRKYTCFSCCAISYN
eukprot:scaffold195751_cov15-Tisochrysis_lutea.AAC.1